MRRLVLAGLLLALPLLAVPLVWAAANGGGGGPGVCAAGERSDRSGIAAPEPHDAPVRWDAHAHAVPADRMTLDGEHARSSPPGGARCSPHEEPRHGPSPVRAVEQVRASATRIAFEVVAPAAVEVEIRSASGQRVRGLGHYTVPARQRLVLAWNGRDDAGRPLGRGAYVAVVTAGGGRDGRFRAPFELR